MQKIIYIDKIIDNAVDRVSGKNDASEEDIEQLSNAELLKVMAETLRDVLEEIKPQQ